MEDTWIDIDIDGSTFITTWVCKECGNSAVSVGGLRPIRCTHKHLKCECRSLAVSRVAVKILINKLLELS